MIGLLAVTLFAAAEQPPSFDAFFADFTKKREAIHSVEARFTQKNVTPEETVQSEGSIVYRKPRRIVFRYDKPDAGTTYLLDGLQAYEYEPDIKQLEIYRLENKAQTEVFFLGFDDNTESLRKNYNVDVFKGGDSEIGAYGIAIRPKKTDDGKANFREVKLFLRQVDDLPYGIHITNDDGSEVFIAVSDFTVNGKVDPAKARIAVPQGTKIIDDDQVLETIGPDGKTFPATESVSVEPLPEPGKKEGASK